MQTPIAMLLIAAGTLVILSCNTLTTGCFLRSPPRGESGVGLVVVFIAVLAGAAMVVLGSLFASMRQGRLITSMMGSSAWTSGALTILVSVGICALAFLSLAAWAELPAGGNAPRMFKAGLFMATGITAPLGLAIVLCFDLSQRGDAVEVSAGMVAAVRRGCWVLAALSSLGYAAALFAFGTPLLAVVRRTVHDAAASMRRAGVSLPAGVNLQAELKLELDKLPADASAAMFFEYFSNPVVIGDEPCRALLTQRILTIGDVDGQLMAAMRSRALRVRWGAAQFIGTTPEPLLESHRDAWAAALEAGIQGTAEDMQTTPMFLLDFDLRPDPHEFVQSLIDAASRFSDPGLKARLTIAIRKLSGSANALRRDKYWNKLARVLKNTGYQIPEQ